jgi:predicted porin
MKKTLVAIAALSAFGAFAQSSVTLFGVADARLAIGNGDTASVTALRNSGLSSSQLGFKGTEDLGGGMKANFWLEGSANTDDGTGSGTNTNNSATGVTAAQAGNQGFTFNRRAFVSVGGNFGEIRLGRDYTPHFWNHTFYDAFGTNGVGTSVSAAVYFGAGGSTAVRASNSIAYNGDFGGFNVKLMTYFGEQASTTAGNVGSGNSLRLGYDNGPISVGLGYGKTNTGANTDVTSTNLGGSYDLGMVKLMAVVSKDSNTGAFDVNGTNLGITAPVGPGLVRAAFSRSESNGVALQQFAIGYNYNMSKRTTVYATLAALNGSGGVAPSLNGSVGTLNSSATGFDLGIKHSF